jgi:hypothetical protein
VTEEVTAARPADPAAPSVAGTAAPLAVLRRLGRDGYLMFALAFMALRLFQVKPWDQSVDAYAYWSTAHGPMYGQSAGVLGAYLYPPVFAQLLTPVTILPWPVFATVWTGLNFAALWFLIRRWSLPAMLFLPIPFEIISGNVHLLYAAAVVLGFRASASWVLMLVTKVTPGVGLLWFAVRREWRALLAALAATGALVAVSVALDPEAWRSWIAILGTSSSTPATPGWFLPVPLAIRLPAAAVLAVAAPLLGRRWVVPVAVVLALPVVWLNALAVLAACVPLWRLDARTPAGDAAL